MSIYQAYFVVTVILCLIWEIREILSKRWEWKVLAGRILRQVFGGIAACLGYLFLLFLLERTGYLGLTKTRGMDRMFQNMFLWLVQSVKDAYRVFYEYYFTDVLICNSWRRRDFFNLIVLLLILFSLGALFKERKTHSLVNLGLLVCLVSVFPIALTLIVILAPGASVYAETGMLMLVGMNYFYIFLLLLVSAIKKKSTGFRLITTTAIGVCSVLLLIQIVFAGVFARMIQMEQTKVQMLAYQIENRIETLDDYSSGQKVLVTGRPQWGNYPATRDRIGNITKGMISAYTLTFGADEQVSAGWISLFEYFCGVRYEECDTEEKNRILASEEYALMNDFPAKSSVKRIGNVVVVKLSPVLDAILQKMQETENGV